MRARRNRGRKSSEHCPGYLGLGKRLATLLHREGELLAKACVQTRHEGCTRRHAIARREHLLGGLCHIESRSQNVAANVADPMLPSRHLQKIMLDTYLLRTDEISRVQ